VRRIFYISFILEFFYALMIMYTPIYLIDLGFSWDKIGIIFTAMLLPFVFFQYPIGALADKKTGEKELLIFSIFLMGASALVVYFIGTGTVFIWSVILFSTRIGAALIEILRDSYFFKRIDGYDVDIINIFRSAKPIAYIAASAISAVVIYFFSVRAVFILVGVVVLSALLPAIRLVDNKCEREMSVGK
jgi:MFS family permease